MSDQPTEPDVDYPEDDDTDVAEPVISGDPDPLPPDGEDAGTDDGVPGEVEELDVDDIDGDSVVADPDAPVVYDTETPPDDVDDGWLAFLTDETGAWVSALDPGTDMTNDGFGLNQSPDYQAPDSSAPQDADEQDPEDDPGYVISGSYDDPDYSLDAPIPGYERDDDQLSMVLDDTFDTAQGDELWDQWQDPDWDGSPDEPDPHPNS